MGNINEKNSPNQMRVFLKRMRECSGDWKNETVVPSKKNLSFRSMLNITRKLNENTGELNLKTSFDQSNEEKKFLNYFKDLMVNVKFIELEVYDSFVFWGGTIDGIIQFVFKVTSNESTSGVEFNYLEDFSPDNPANDEIIKRVEAYYEVFYQYWQRNVVQK